MHTSRSKPFNIIDRGTLFEPRETSVSADQSYDSDCSEAIMTGDWQDYRCGTECLLK